MKYIKLSGKLYLTGPDGITRAEPLGEWHSGRKVGNNTEIFSSKGSIGWIKETVDEIEVMLNPININPERKNWATSLIGMESKPLDNKKD